MHIQPEQIGSATVAHIESDSIDARNVSMFQSEMFPIIVNCSRVVLDLEEVHFVDSSGIGAILGCLRQCTGAGGMLKICCVNAGVQEGFALVRMANLLDIYDTCSGAVASFDD